MDKKKEQRVKEKWTGRTEVLENRRKREYKELKTKYTKTEGSLMPIQRTRGQRENQGTVNQKTKNQRTQNQRIQNQRIQNQRTENQRT